MPPPDRDDPDDEDTERRRPTAAEPARRRQTYPHGAPAIQGVETDFGDPTGDLDTLYGELPTSRDHDALRRARRDPGASVTWAELSTVVRLLRGQLAADLARLRDTVEGAPGQPGLTQTVASHAQVIGPARSAASWALRGAVAALLVVGGLLYWRGRDEQHVLDEIQAARKDNDRLEGEINQLRQTPTSKDPRP